MEETKITVAEIPSGTREIRNPDYVLKTDSSRQLLASLSRVLLSRSRHEAAEISAYSLRGKTGKAKPAERTALSSRDIYDVHARSSRDDFLSHTRAIFLRAKRKGKWSHRCGTAVFLSAGRVVIKVAVVTYESRSSREKITLIIEEGRTRKTG